MSAEEWGEESAEEMPVEFDGEEGAPVAAPLRLGVGVHDISIAQYLADPCPEPSLRSSDIQRMLHQRPAHVRALHPRLTDPALRDYAIRKATKRMDTGSVIHELVLGMGAGFAVINPADYKTKKGEPCKTMGAAEVQAAIAEAKSRGLVVLDPKQNTNAQRAADRLMPKLAEEFGGWPFGAVEQTFIWKEEVELPDGNVIPVWCRTRPDFNSPPNAVYGDLKSSAAGLSDDELQRTLSGDNGRTFIQAAWQRRGFVATYPELAGRVDVVHPFIEVEPPYECRIVRLSEAALEMADRRCRRAVEMFAACLASGEWPGWDETRISPAGWLDTKWVAEEEEAFS